MSLESAKKHIEKFNLLDRISIHNVVIPTVADAATQIGCSESQIAKTLAFIVKESPILIVMAGDSKVNNKEFKNNFGTKAKMIKPEYTLELIGHEIGGICPFGIKDNVLVYLDESLKKHDIIYPACGRRDSSIKLSIEELEKVSNFEYWVNLCD